MGTPNNEAHVEIFFKNWLSNPKFCSPHVFSPPLSTLFIEGVLGSKSLFNKI